MDCTRAVQFDFPPMRRQSNAIDAKFERQQTRDVIGDPKASVTIGQKDWSPWSVDRHLRIITLFISGIYLALLPSNLQ